MTPAGPPFPRPCENRISDPSQVIRTVQLNPRMDIKPKLRCWQSVSGLYGWISNSRSYLEDGLLAEADQIISIAIVASLKGLHAGLVVLHISQISELVASVVETHGCD